MSTGNPTYGTGLTYQDTQVPAPLNVLLTVYVDDDNRFEIEAVSNDPTNLVPHAHVVMAFNDMLRNGDRMRSPHSSIQKSVTASGIKKLFDTASKQGDIAGSGYTAANTSENTMLLLGTGTHSDRSLEKELRKLAKKVSDAIAKRASLVTRQSLQFIHPFDRPWSLDEGPNPPIVSLPPWLSALDIMLMDESGSMSCVRIEVPTLEESEFGPKSFGSTIKGLLGKK